MRSKSSRYRNVQRFESPASGERFPGLRPRSIVTPAGVLEHVLSVGDRLDLLALHYYNNPGKWWLILDANPELGYAGSIDIGEHVGEVIVIPQDQSHRRSR